MPVNGFQLETPESSAPISPSDSWIVQKFGGTSVGKFAVQIVDNVIRVSAIRDRVAVVCSARSSSTKAEGTTNRLLRAARDAETSQTKHFYELIDAVRLEHIEVAQELIKSPQCQATLIESIEAECSHVLRILEAACILGETSAKCVDMVMSAGEKLSCLFMTALLQDRGVDAEYVDLSELINFPADQLNQKFYDNLASALANKVLACKAKVPVITGYFGVVPGGLLDKVGRGYTDLCAALVAVGVQARELQVWKEVDGIFTADPRKVPTARLLSSITPAEAAELTFYGSEVIHPFTMEQVIRAHIPIRIKNVIKPKGKGTIIVPDSSFTRFQVGSSKLFRTRSSCNFAQLSLGPKRPTAVTAKNKILVINVHSNKRSLSHGFFAGIFSVLDKWRLSIDLISTSEVHVSLALHSEAPLFNGFSEDEFQIIDEDLKGAIQDLSKYGTIDIIPNMCILSLVGNQMQNMVGVAGSMFSTLGEHNVNIEMISQVKLISHALSKNGTQTVR
ncbi:Proteasome subunit beta type-6 [Ascosphaera pollenicola]|nr:Proteasome subunit beta type-6 [Ascosphaera pollenicola]